MYAPAEKKPRLGLHIQAEMTPALSAQPTVHIRYSPQIDY